VSLVRAKTVQQRPLLPREVETWLPDCGVTYDQLWLMTRIREEEEVVVTIRAAVFRTHCSLPMTLFGAPTRIMLP